MRDPVITLFQNILYLRRHRTLIKVFFMAIIQRNIVFSLLLLCFISNGNSTVCPCFNAPFLSSIFHDSKNVHCTILRERNKILDATISDGKHSASTAFDQCALHADHMNITKDYVDPYIDENDICTKAILSACLQLKVKISS